MATCAEQYCNEEQNNFSPKLINVTSCDIDDTFCW